MAKLEWKFYEGGKVNNVKVQADLSCAEDFVISHRPEQYNISYRPTGHHIHVGCCPTLKEAQQKAEAYILPDLNECRPAGCTGLHA